jgi:hypothetical protein
MLGWLFLGGLVSLELMARLPKSKNEASDPSSAPSLYE